MIVPLKILITDSSLLADGTLAEQIAKLEKAGHSVTIDDSLKQYDFVTGPNCWLLRPEVVNLFILAITNARKVKAHENKERMDQASPIKACKATAKPARKPRTRNSTVEGSTEPAQDILPGQLSFTTECTAIGGTGGSSGL